MKPASSVTIPLEDRHPWERKIGVSPIVAVMTFAVCCLSLLATQQALLFFPGGFSYQRLPCWGPVSYPMIQQYIDQQRDKKWVLIGDSVFHGDTAISNQATGHLLSERGGFINLTNPSLTFPMEALFIRMVIERYPQKWIIAELNPKWFVSNWIPDKFEMITRDLETPLAEPAPGPMSTVQRALSLKMRFLYFVSLDGLRLKIRYRWLNQSVTQRLLQRYRGEQNEFKNLPFAIQEMRLEQRPPSAASKEPFEPDQIKELSQFAALDPAKFEAQEAYQTLFAMFQKAKGRIGAVITPLDPDAISKIPPQAQRNYKAVLDTCISQLKKNGIPYIVLDLPSSQYLDYNHFLPSGHWQCFLAIQKFCATLQT